MFDGRKSLAGNHVEPVLALTGTGSFDSLGMRLVSLRMTINEWIQEKQQIDKLGLPPFNWN